MPDRRPAAAEAPPAGCCPSVGTLMPLTFVRRLANVPASCSAMTLCWEKPFLPRMRSTNLPFHCTAVPCCMFQVRGTGLRGRAARPALSWARSPAWPGSKLGQGQLRQGVAQEIGGPLDRERSRRHGGSGWSEKSSLPSVRSGCEEARPRWPWPAAGGLDGAAGNAPLGLSLRQEPV